MNFDLHARMRSDPHFDLEAKLDPIGVDLGVEGALSATLGAIQGKVSEIPIRVRIPFLRRRPVMVASIGGFRVSTRPVGLAVEKGRLHIGGVVGQDGMRVVARGHVKCETEAESHGRLIGRAGELKLNFADEEESAS